MTAGGRSRRSRLLNRVPEGLAQLIDALWRKKEAGGTDQLLVTQHVVRDGLSFDLLLEQQNPVHEALGSRRTPGDVDIDGNNRVDALNHRVVVEDSAG